MANYHSPPCPGREEDVTQLYAERNAARAREIMGEIG